MIAKIVLTIFLIGNLVFIAVITGHGIFYRRSRFNAMKRAGLVLSWTSFAEHLDRGEGTVILAAGTLFWSPESLTVDTAARDAFSTWIVVDIPWIFFVKRRLRKRFPSVNIVEYPSIFLD